MNIHDPAEEIVALRAEIDQFRLLANNLPAAIAYYERDGFTCRYANIGYATMFGYTEQSILGLSFARIIGTEAASFIQPKVDVVLRQRVRASYERQLTDASGNRRWIEVDLLPHVGPHGEAVGAFVMINDITRHREAERALRESEERQAKFLHATTEGIVFHRGGLITDANPPLLALLGYTIDEIRGRPALDFVAPDERARVAGVMASGAEIGYETAVSHRNGTVLPVEFIVRTMDYGGKSLRMTIVRDLRDRIEARSRIHHLAHHDALTGLPNRTAFLDRAQSLIVHARSAGLALSMLFIDLDHFKRVNDSLGHLAGDTLLQTVAQRITGNLRAGDLVARFGGDEFIVLLGGNTPPAAVQDVAAKLLQAIAAPLEAGGVSISVTPSIGIAMFPQDGASADELIQHADTAMYHAKATGRATYRCFEPAMEQAAVADLELEARLVRAVQAGEFVLHYQPQVSLADGRLTGCEALIRWSPPGQPMVAPDAFIPLAEERRLMLPIGRWVLREALAAARRWHGDRLLDVPVAVNLSSLEFHAADFVTSVEAALAETGCPGSLLELELTERMLMDDIGHVRGALERLKRLGVSISVDDFGTGYTSLAHLKDLPVDRLKIDRSFVCDLPDDRGAGAIARAIIQMAASLGLATVAEGVETESQRAWVAANGCGSAQGHLVARPMAEADFARWLAARPPR